jgi:hypothetical protein
LEVFENYRRSTPFCTTFLHFLFINFDKKWLGLHFGRFFHEAIWSPCLRGSFFVDCATISLQSVSDNNMGNLSKAADRLKSNFLVRVSASSSF